MKTVRFAVVVARCGKPHPHAFWVQPEHDKEFLATQKAHRVMTVAPVAAGKTDVGFVGFDPKRAGDSQVLIFPKSLRPFEGCRVVGIKFDQLEQPALVAAKDPSVTGAHRPVKAVASAQRDAIRPPPTPRHRWR